MELFERIRYISRERKIPLSKIAEYLGYSQQNFNKWFDKKAQRRFWEHLPKIMELFPDVRPEWLYMGQEPAFEDGTRAQIGSPNEELLKAEIERLESELREERALNRELTARLLLEGVGEHPRRSALGNQADQHDKPVLARVAGQE